jgi:E3 ubiquitin-protein ligase TRIP12
MASFLGTIISSKDNALFVMSALQLVELLVQKLPDVYQTSFHREGVVFEIEALANDELSTVKAANEAALAVKTEPEEPSTPVAGPSTTTLPPPPALIDDVKPTIPGTGTGMSAALSSFLLDVGAPPSTVTPRRSSPHTDPADANIIRARVLGAKKTFEVEGDHKSAATAVLDDVADLVKRLCSPEATEAELRDSLRTIASQFSNLGQALSSFELLKSGLVDGLLEFVDIDGAVSSSDRRLMLFETFSDTTLSSPSPLTMLVKRLHESLGRLENFEVETAFNGVADSSRPSSSTLGRTMRVRLQADEGQDVPKQVSNMSVTIQAIAPLQALHDYLRPRIADGNYMTGSSLSSMFASYGAYGGLPIPRGSGSSASRLLSALAGVTGESGILGGSGLGASAIASSAPEPSRINPPAASANNAAPSSDQSRPQPRRSARLSAHGVGEADAPLAPEEPAPLSSSAPEPSILPSMPMDMDFDEYSDEEYDAEVSCQTTTAVEAD